MANEAKSELKKGLMEAFLRKSPEELMEIAGALMRFAKDLALFSESEREAFRKHVHKKLEGEKTT